jgi:hypothetical protein
MLPIHYRQRMREHRTHLEQSRVVAFFGLGKTPQARRSAHPDFKATRRTANIRADPGVIRGTQAYRRCSGRDTGTRRWQG